MVVAHGSIGTASSRSNSGCAPCSRPTRDAADAQTSRQGVRDILRAAFSRARGLGLTVEGVDDALAVPAPPIKATPAKK